MMKNLIGACLLGAVLGSAVPQAAAQYPPVPDLVAVPVDATTIALRWSAPQDSDGTYEHQVAVSSDGPIPMNMFNYYHQWGRTLTYYDDPHPAGTPEEEIFTGLLADTRYWFAVVCYNTNDRINGYSGDVSGATLDLVAPGSVTDLALMRATSGGVILQWTSPGDNGSDGLAAGYDLRYSTIDPGPDLGAWWTAPETLAVTEPPGIDVPGMLQSTLVGGLDGGRTYWFAIRAYDEAGNESPLWNVVSALTDSVKTPSESASGNDGLGCGASARAGMPAAAFLGLVVAALGSPRRK